MTATSPFALTQRAFAGAAAGGLLAGAADILYACGMAAAAGRSPMRILQSVGSGLIGSAAFQGGLSTALLGLLCHFVITLGAALVYLLAYARVPWLRAHFVLGAVGFGVAVYAVMHGLVLPLSAIPFKMVYSLSSLAQGLAVHVLLVGFPIALCVRRLSFPQQK